MNTYYLQAATESAILTALELAGLAQAIPAQTITEPEHEADQWSDVDDALDDELIALYGLEPVSREHNGVTYYCRGDCYMTLETITVPERTYTTPAHRVLPEGVHLVWDIHVPGEVIGMGDDNQPIRAPVPGFHANLHCDERYGDISIEQHAMLPIIPPPRNPVSVLA